MIGALKRRWSSWEGKGVWVEWKTCLPLDLRRVGCGLYLPPTYVLSSLHSFLLFSLRYQCLKIRELHVKPRFSTSFEKKSDIWRKMSSDCYRFGTLSNWSKGVAIS